MKRTTTLQYSQNRLTQAWGILTTMDIRKGNFLPTFFAIIILFFVTNTTWGCTMVCNNQVNVSLPFNCQAEITYDMILEDPNNPLVCTPNGSSAYVVFVMDQYGQVIPTSPVVTSDYIGQLLSVKVKHWASGNSCWGSILVEDKLPPQLTCPSDITIQCTDPTDTLFTGGLIATDCSNFTTNYSDNLEVFGCNNPVAILTRTFTGVDEYGNYTSCSQTIFIEEPNASSVQFPPNRDGITGTAIPCENPNTDPSNTGYPTINGSPITNNGLCNIAVTFNDNQIPLCDGMYKILRAWTVANWCTGSVVTKTQIIKVADDQGPDLTCPPDLTVGTTSSLYCTASVILPPIQVSDNCSSTFTYQITTPGGLINTNGGIIHNISTGVYNVTYTVSDACGNQSSCQITLTVEDSTSPAVICDEFTVVSLQPDGYVTIFAQTFDDGTYDNCCLDYFEARRMITGCGQGPVFSNEVSFCCDDIGEDVAVEFRAVDCAGNANSCMVTVHVDDNSDPVITCPPNKTISCTEDYTDLNLTGQPVAFDGCGIANMTHTDQVNLNTCNEGTVVRTWTVTDNYGNTSSCNQLITIVDNTPVTVTFPDDYDLVNGCTSAANLHPDSLPAPFNYPIVFGDDCELVGLNYDDQIFQIATPACFKIVRTWSLIDWCTFVPNSGNNAGFYEQQQVLKVFDNEAPELTCPDNITVEITGTDCVGTVNLPNASVEDCSQSVNINVTSDLGVGSGPFMDVSIGTYTATYQATDGCGNSSSCQIDISVVDGKKPTPYCKNGLIIELMQTGMVDIWADDFDNGSFDNCPGGVQVSFSADVDDTSIIYDCDHVGQQNIEMWVTDAAGNQDFCNTFVIVQDNMNVCNTGNPLMVNVSGMVTDEMGITVENATISVNDGVTNPIITSGSGAYKFDSLIVGNDYTVSPEKNMNYLNGVTTYDLVVLRKHILHINYLDSPYKIIAADANNSGTVTTTDMVELQKLILFVNDELADNNSWRFVDKNYQFQNPDDPLSEVFPEVYNINNLSDDMLDLDFIGIKVGDLNNSAIPNMLVDLDDRNVNEKLTFEVNDQKTEIGKTYKIDFRANDFNEIEAYQFTVKFDIDALEFVDFERGELSVFQQNFGMTQLKDGILTTSWYDIESQNLDKEAVLFSLIFNAKSEDRISENIMINSSLTKAEAYSRRGEQLGVTLHFNEKVDVLLSAEFTFFQNQPNPFHNSTKIRFQLPTSQLVRLTVMDISGKMLLTKTGFFEEGLNHITIDENDLNTSGTLIYRLETPTNTAIGKMILIK
jgi:hypothetical protein